METKVCTKCLRVMPVGWFYARKSGARDGLASNCKTCVLERMRARASIRSYPTLHERFWSKVTFARGAAGCWLWVGSLNEDGYGMLGGRGGERRVHRIAYVVYVGPIPEGNEIDHLCRVRNCVRPDHLEPVTHALNMHRARPWQYQTRRNVERRRIDENV